MNFPSMEKVVSRLIGGSGRRGAPYNYSPVDKEASEIRLMTLLPGVFGTKISITIGTTVLSKSQVPEYEALSYTWGSVERTAYIYIQDTERESALAVTSNLAEALQYLRYEDKPRTLWIDAICVDQTNIPERGHQVTRMAKIYPQASRVVVWLGPERDNSALAMRELDALGSTVEVDWNLSQITPLSGDDYDQWLRIPLPFMKDHNCLVSIASLLDRSWFKRLWIWQEIQLARSGAQIVCGRNGTLWDTFRNAILCLLLRYLTHDIAENVPAKFRAGINRAMVVCNYNQLGSRLEDLLKNARAAQCSDDRDRIYAVLNLTGGKLGLESDYSKTTEEVFKSVVLGYASTQKDLSLLGQCEMRQNKRPSVPSWVPDWATSNKCNRIENSRASLTTEAQFRCNKKDVLVVSCCMIASLDVIEQIPPRDSTFNRNAQFYKIVSKLMRGKTENDLYVAGGFMIDAICRTLCNKNFTEDYLPLSQHLPSYRNSKEYVRKLIEIREPIEPRGYIDEVYRSVKGRAFFLTKNGYIGLGPKSMKTGDQACVILGCKPPLILRPDDEKSYRVVGDCYIDGFKDGEALLGALLSDWHYVLRYFPDLKDSFRAFLNTKTGDIQVEDPRLGPLPAGWRIGEHRNQHAFNRFSNDETGILNTWVDPRLSPEALKARGVNLQEIRLV